MVEGCSSLTRLTARIWPRCGSRASARRCPPLSVTRGLPDYYRQVATGFDAGQSVVAGRCDPTVSVATRHSYTVRPQQMPRIYRSVTRGLRVVGAASQLLSRRRTGPGDVGPGAPWRAAGQGGTGSSFVRRYRCSIRSHQVSSADVVVGLPMRCVFALTAMGFFPSPTETISADELIQVGYRRRGCRLDARFGGYRHRGRTTALVLRDGRDGSFRIAVTHGGSRLWCPHQRQPGKLPRNQEPGGHCSSCRALASERTASRNSAGSLARR